MAEQDDIRARTTGRVLQALVRARDEAALEKFRERRSGDGQIALSKLLQMRDVLDRIGDILTATDERSWQQLDAAWQILCAAADPQKVPRALEASGGSKPAEPSPPSADKSPALDAAVSTAPPALPGETANGVSTSAGDIGEPAAPLASDTAGAATDTRRLSDEPQAPPRIGSVALIGPPPPVVIAEARNSPWRAAGEAPSAAVVPAPPAPAPVVAMPALARPVAEPPLMVELPVDEMTATLSDLASDKPLITPSLADGDGALPFRGQGTAPPPVAADLPPMTGSVDETAVGGLQLVLDNVLPFDEIPKMAQPSAAVSPAAKPAPEAHARTLAAPAALSLEQFAALCAQRAVYPAHANEVNARYGLHQSADISALDEHWRQRMHDDARVRQEYQRLLAHYQQWFAAKAAATREV